MSGKRKRSTDEAARLNAAAKAAYNGFIRECGYEKDARIMDFEKLTDAHKQRWTAVAKDVIAAHNE